MVSVLIKSLIFGVMSCITTFILSGRTDGNLYGLVFVIGFFLALGYLSIKQDNLKIKEPVSIVDEQNETIKGV